MPVPAGSIPDRDAALTLDTDCVQPLWILRVLAGHRLFAGRTMAPAGGLYMHEMGIALEIIEIVRSSIPESVKRPRVERVHLKIGRLSAVVTDSLRFCFEIASEETPLAGAELVVDEIPVEAQCNDCGHRWTIDEPVFVCTSCRGGSLTLLSGRELDVHSFQLIDEENDHAH